MHAVIEKVMQQAPGILEGMTTAVLLLDQQLEIVYLNPAGEDMLQLSALQAVSRSLDEVLPDEPDFLARLWDALENQRPYSQRELRLHLLGDRAVTVDSIVTPLGGPNEIQGILLELLPLDRHLRITREEHLLAQQKGASKLLRGLAHEIKNPLGGLRGAAQLLEGELEEEGLKEYTRIIIGEADRLQNLVDRMLGPNNLPQPRETNIHQVLEHVRSLVLAEGHRDLVIERDYDPSIPEFSADPELLVQAVLNLTRNAAQAGASRVYFRTRAQRKFTIGNQRHKLVVQTEIIDNGRGIPEDILEQIFYPMVTGRPEGTGLGLSIAQSLVNQHGGLIECSSRPGRTNFTILLPLE
jgi:two-component system nitrogen regulation sensor histidine kinase GlnL